MVAGIVLTIAFVSIAFAQTRDDNWTRCADDHADADLKIGACTALIQSGQETNENLSAAFYNRGLAYQAKGDNDRAIQDYDQAISLNPKDDAAFKNRGLAKFFESRFPAAAEDLAQALALKAAEPYSVLWLHLARARSKSDDKAEFQHTAASLDLAKWPGPVIAYYLKQVARQKLLEVAIQGDTKTQKEQGCEASFFLGEDALLHNKTADARRLFLEAKHTCPPNFIEFTAAVAELKKIGK